MPKRKDNEEFPAAVRMAVLADLAEEKPSVSEWKEWVTAKAIFYEVEEEKLKALLASHEQQIDTAIKFSADKEAARIARALGATRVEALNKMKQIAGLGGAPGATKKLVRTHGADVIYEQDVPDYATQYLACVKICELHQMFAPREMKIEHEFGVTDQLAALSEKDLFLRAAELHRQVGKVLKQPEEFIDAEFTDAERAQLEAAGAGIAPDSAGAEVQESRV